MEVAVPMELHYKHSFLTAQEAIEATDRERSQSEPPPPSRELEVAEDAQHEVSKKTSYTAGLLQKARELREGLRRLESENYCAGSVGGS
mmetsp:Transcript_35566/g.85206  ORF Transcript_35566/g.85206 Transcript_35566/m.85206 type:complete len:89 (-) Transcript_35566:52-318(-)